MLFSCIYSFIYSVNFTVFRYFDAHEIEKREKRKKERSVLAIVSTYVSCISREANRTVANTGIRLLVRLVRSFNYKWFRIESCFRYSARLCSALLSLFLTHYSIYFIFVLQLKFILMYFSHIHTLIYRTAYDDSKYTIQHHVYIMCRVLTHI